MSLQPIVSLLPRPFSQTNAARAQTPALPDGEKEVRSASLQAEAETLQSSKEAQSAISYAAFQTIYWKELKDRLFALYQKYPALTGGDASKGEIQVVTDPGQIEKIESVVEQNLLKKGVAPERAKEWSRAGVMSEDGYFIQLRDAVKFPNGTEGLYNRQLERSALNGTQGAVAMPLLENGNILFNLTYRHATRDYGYQMELARGFSKPGEPPVQTAIRELQEETGMKAQSPIHLGVLAPNSGAAGTTPSIFLCPVTGQGKSRVGNEAIKKCISFSPQEVANALANGYFIYENKKVPFIDAFSFSALLKAHASGHIKLPPADRNPIV